LAAGNGAGAVACEVDVQNDRLRLVVAISDLGEDSDVVVRYAAQIALQTQARLRVVHPFAALGKSLRKVLFSVPSLDQRIQTASAALAEQGARVTAGTGIAYETVLDHNSPEQVLIRQAAYGLADMVVAGASHFADSIALRTLASVRTPCFFVRAQAESNSSRSVIQALTPRVAPDVFLRTQRWLRTLRALPVQPLHAPSQTQTNGGTLELDVLLCPEPADGAPSCRIHAAEALRRTFGESAPALIAALIDAEGADEELEFAETLHTLLLAEAPCPVLYMPPLAAQRTVPDPLPA